jgi:two-component system, sensor histidine kinase and response regulator
VILMVLAYRIHLGREKLRRMALDKRLLEDEVSLRTGELRDSNRRLEEASQAKNNFLARMSHELRTPLNGVVGSSELLARTSQSTAQSRLTETIRSSAKVLLKIVNDLLDLSKIQAGKLELEALPFDVAATLEDCSTLLAPGAANKGVDLIVSPPPRTAWLKGDQLRIRQIVMNLLGNAIKFTAHGEIVVSADVEATAQGSCLLHLEVSDTGMGMDAATIGRVFEPFTQADESTTRRFGGTGLGLAICRELVEHMGGRIEVNSKANVGSTFHVSIPLEAAEPAAAQSPPLMDGMPVRLLTRRPALRKAMERHAAALGVTLTALPDPESCDWRAPGVIVADWASCQQPLAQALRLERTDLPPLLIVAPDEAWNALRKACPGANAMLISTPIRREDLRGALAQALNRDTPAAAGAASIDAALPEVAAATHRPSAVRGHVLLVEDEAVNMAVAQGYLAELGCTSCGANNGAEAVSRSATEKFDLIMMDLNMPDMDGFEATRLIRKGERAGAHVPIVAITAHQAASYRDACLAAGMDDILSKPYTFDECARLIGRFLPSPASKDAPGSLADIASLTGIDPATVSGLRSLRGAGPNDLYVRLVDLFQTSSGASLRQLQGALSCGDSSAAAAACHKLAAAAANVGALAFAREVRRIEQLCGNTDSSAATGAAARLAHAHPALCMELDAFKLQASA